MRKFTSVAAGCGVFALYIFLHGVLNMTGFCWDDKRWLSDNEKIEKVLAFVNRQSNFRIFSDHPLPGNSVINEYISYTMVPYKNVSEMHSKNMDCCRIEKLRMATPLGFDTGEQIEMNLLIQYRSEDKSIAQRKANILATYDNCMQHLWLSHELSP